MNPYGMLAAAVVFEVFADTCMKLSEGFSKKLPIAGIVVGYAVSFYFLAGALYAIPLGAAYAIWTGVAIALTAIVGRIIWREQFNAKKLAGMAIIVAGVVVLRLAVTA